MDAPPAADALQRVALTATTLSADPAAYTDAKSSRNDVAAAVRMTKSPTVTLRERAAAMGSTNDTAATALVSALDAFSRTA